MPADRCDRGIGWGSGTNLPANRLKYQRLRDVPESNAQDLWWRGMRALQSQEGTGARGLEFLILTSTRTGEVIKAYLDEFDIAGRLWTIPDSRMKAGREHRVALSTRAIAILERQKDAAQYDFVFPALKVGTPLSNMAFLQLLKRIQRNDLTAHEYRSSFRDWAAEQTTHPSEVVEIALAHAIGDKVVAG
jgi:integrase